MLYWAAIFIIALVAAVFGFGGLADKSAYIAKILAVIGIIMAIITSVFHRRSRRG